MKIAATAAVAVLLPGLRDERNHLGSVKREIDFHGVADSCAFASMAGIALTSLTYSIPRLSMRVLCSSPLSIGIVGLILILCVERWQELAQLLGLDGSVDKVSLHELLIEHGGWRSHIPDGLAVFHGTAEPVAGARFHVAERAVRGDRRRLFGLSLQRVPDYGRVANPKITPSPVIPSAANDSAARKASHGNFREQKTGSKPPIDY